MALTFNIVITLALLSLMVPLPNLVEKGWFGRLRKKYFYHSYLRSKCWKAKRKQRYNYDKGICQGCGKPVGFDEFECHHVTYSRFGNEPMSHIQTLHKECHRQIDHRNIR